MISSEYGIVSKQLYTTAVHMPSPDFQPQQVDSANERSHYALRKIGVVGLAAGIALTATAGVVRYFQPDPCVAEVTPRNSDGAEFGLYTPDEHRVMLIVDFRTANRVRVTVGDESKTITPSQQVSGPEIVYPVGQATNILVDVTPQAVTTMCQATATKPA